jgi:hypothetical protein
MTKEQFNAALSQDTPDAGLSQELQSLWYDKKGDWDTAHTIAQSIQTERGSAIHAYLHREEGDLGNASYWYNRAGRERPTVALEEEWEALLTEMLGV